MRLATVLISVAAYQAHLGSWPGHLLSPDSTLQARVEIWRAAHEGQIVTEYVNLLAIPNLAADSRNIRRNATAIVDMLTRRGITARLLEAPGSPPAVYGEQSFPGASRTVVLYAHYDGQPVDESRWASAPWKPILRSRALATGGEEVAFPAKGARFDPESRLYARSTGDDKGSIIAQIAALDALRALGVTPSINLKFLFEGEEEAGSPHLRDMLQLHSKLLRADLWLMGDGPVSQTGRQQITFGVRGDLGLSLTVFGPSRPLHSGHYGNWAPNPDVMLVHLLASMRDEDGKILIDHFYDDVRSISSEERGALESMPSVDQQLMAELRIGRSEGSPATLAEQVLLPALNLSGLSGGETGANAANVIVSEATAFIDLRLVPDQQPERVKDQILRHLRKQGFFVVSGEPDSATRRAHLKVVKAVFSAGYPASRLGLDLPVSRAVIAASSEEVVPLLCTAKPGRLTGSTSIRPLPEVATG